MGSSSSKNEVKQSVKVLTEVVTNTFQSCTSQGSNVSNIEINCTGPGTECTLDCDVTQYVGIDAKCVAESSTSTQLNNDITTKAKQQAKAVGNAFQLSSTKTQNLEDLYVELANTIVKAYSGTCSANALNSTSVKGEGSNGATLKVTCKIDQTINVMSDCVMKNKDVTKVTNDIVNLIDQYGEAKTKGWLTWLIYIAIAVIVLVFGIIALVVLLLAFGVIGGKKGGGEGKEEGMSTTDVINLAAQLI